ncbi:MAG: GNAT family N-acetyltransferase [Synechococcales cyanobacterium]
MIIRVAETDAEILACYPVMKELRPQWERDPFLSQVRQQERAGYRLAYGEESGDVVAVGGFRITENLAWGRFLYIDDLVVRPLVRSKGYGAALLAWLKDYALHSGCQQLHLDSGAQRLDAHRFYEREGMAKTGFHFALDLRVL